MKSEITRPEIGLSPIVLGTMRFAIKGLAAADVAGLISRGIDYGCDTLHVSTEYSSYHLVLESLKLLPKTSRDKTKYIVKLACPHFGEDNFSRDVLVERVDRYLHDLECNSLDLVQWMWRDNQVSDEDRCKKFYTQRQDIKQTFDDLIKMGKVNQFACFPYTSEFMKSVRLAQLTNCQVNYLNLFETAAQDALLEPVSIVLRPYGAGRVFSDVERNRIERKADELQISIDLALPDFAIQFPFLNPSVASVVVGLESITQLRNCIDIARTTTPDNVAFGRFSALQRGLIESQN